jgi:hypothetical protein
MMFALFLCQPLSLFVSHKQRCRCDPWAALSHACRPVQLLLVVCDRLLVLAVGEVSSIARAAELCFSWQAEPQGFAGVCYWCVVGGSVSSSALSRAPAGWF